MKITNSSYAIASSKGYSYLMDGFEVIDGAIFNRFAKDRTRKGPFILVGFVNGKAKVIEEKENN